MNRKLLLAVVLWLLAAGGLAVALCWRPGGGEQRPSSATTPATQEAHADPTDVRQEGDGPLDPPLADLLKESAKGDRGRTSAFFTALDAVARTNGLTLNDYDPTREADEGSALRFGDNVVVVLRGWDHCIPGSDAHSFLLLGRHGQPLDRLTCSIDSRLTRTSAGREAAFHAEAFPQPEKDGAQLVVRFVAEAEGVPAGNWGHFITRAGKTCCFGWPDAGGPGWAQGLCRMAVRDGKFVVLFPALKPAAD
jgi:hypothetical protein